MIYTLKTEGNYRELICEDGNELLNYSVTYLCPGSTAYASATKKSYILSNDKKWVDISTGATIDGSSLSSFCSEYIINNNTKDKHYLCNTEDDLNDIPINRDNIEPGSIASIPSLKETFILGPDYKWYNQETCEQGPKAYTVHLDYWIGDECSMTSADINDGKNNIIYYTPAQGVVQFIFYKGNNITGKNVIWNCPETGGKYASIYINGDYTGVDANFNDNFTEFNNFYCWSEDKYYTWTEFINAYNIKSTDLIYFVFELYDPD